jgi:hypothetical protein
MQTWMSERKIQKWSCQKRRSENLRLKGVRNPLDQRGTLVVE